MIVTSKLSSTVAELIDLLPRGRITATKVVGSLRSWRKYPYLWDPWILKDDVYRLFYLSIPKPDRSLPFWAQGTICGAISKDLRTWTPMGIVLDIDPSNIWEAGRMLAGSTYKENGIYYLFYSAAGPGDLVYEEKIGLATSTDGLNWERYSRYPLFSEDECRLWYGKQKDLDRWHWRDPYILKDPSTGKYYMFISAYSKDGSVTDIYHGCVGLAVSDRISGPYKILPPAAGPTISGLAPWPFVEIERPQVIYRQGKYHLFFSCWPWQMNPKWFHTLANPKIRESSLYWFISDKITGPFKPAASIPVVKGSEKTAIYATNFFSISDNPEELIAIGWYHRLVTLQVLPMFKAHFNENDVEIRKL